MSTRYIRRHIGQLLISGFDGLQIPPEMRSLAREFDLGGIILFKRNVEAPEQVAEVAYSAQELADEQPLWVSVDQEGGRVARLREPFTRWPPMAVLGRAGNGSRKAGGAVREGAGAGAEGGRHHAGFRAGARHPDQPEESRDRRSRVLRQRATW